MKTKERTLIRQDTDYALRMLTQLSDSREEEFSASGLSAFQSVPHGFAQKILRKLSTAGLLTARPGRGGGFRLARTPKEISLMDVVAAIQGPPFLNRCMSDPAACVRQPTCPVSASLRVLQNKFDDYLRTTRLSDIVEQSSSGQPHFAPGKRTSRKETRRKR